MADGCIHEEDLAAALDRADELAVRAHLETCPACRSLVASYRAFLAGDLVADAETIAAERDLARRIAALTGAHAAERSPAADLIDSRWWQRLLRPRARRYALALASASAVVVAVVLWSSKEPAPPTAILLRGEVPAIAGAGMSAHRLADGSVRLIWNRHPGAEAYRVRILSPEMTTLAVMDAAGDTTLQVSAATLTGLAGTARGPLLWDVAPVVQGDALAAPAPRMLPREN